MIILCDLDDTLTNLIVPWVRYLNLKYDLSVLPSSIKHWQIDTYFPTLSPSQVYEVLEEQELWETVVPLDCAPFVVQRLIEDGHEFYITTATKFSTVEYKYKLIIKKYFPFISWDNVIVTSQKHLITGDILIDDAEHNIIKSNHKYKFLQDNDRNANFDERPFGAIRVRGWNDIYDMIKRIENYKKEV